MKDIDKLIESLGKKVIMYHANSIKKGNQGDTIEAAYNDGITKGIELAIKELEMLNDEMTRKFNALI
jgi:hypothetical protein